MTSEIKRRFTDTEMQTARETDLPELLTHLGYQVKRIGRYYTTAEMDSLRIKDRRTWFRYSQGIGGDAITLPNLPSVEKAVDTRKELAEAVGLGERTMGKVMQIDENAPEVIKEALDKKELSINKGYDLTRQLQDIPEEQREQAAAELLEYEKAKKELKKQDAEIDRKGKIAALFCKAYEKAILLTPSEENVRCWTDGTRMTPEEMRDTVKESREIAQVFAAIADIIEQKILPADWRCVDAGNEENGAQPDGNPA